MVYTPEDNKEDEQIIYLKKPSKKQKKKKVYVSESESDEEIIYLKKPKTKPKPKPQKQQSQQIIEDLDEEAKLEKEKQDKIVENHYNDKIALIIIRREYLMKSVFHA